MRFVTMLLAAMALVAGTAAPAGASTMKTLYSFCKKSGCKDGGAPNGVMVAPTGEIYGTAQGGNQVFELLPKSGGEWKYKALYTFCSQPNCADGLAPFGKLIMDVDGDLYGTTFQGGFGNQGVVFELIKAANHKKWTYKTLAQFCTSGNCGPAVSPEFGLAYAGESSGALYDGKSPLFGIAGGGTPFGKCNPDCGTVYELTLKGKTWSIATIYEFCAVMFATCPDGSRPMGELLVDATGKTLTGAAEMDAGGTGAVFRLTHSGSSWTESLLYSFCQIGDNCNDGAAPSAGVTPDAAGNLYGMTDLGGGAAEDGVIYKVTSPLHEQALYSFCKLTNCADGRHPVSNNILIDTSGNLFGATFQGGGHDIDQEGLGGGTLFKFNGSALQTLYSFCAQPSCTDGEYPTDQIAFGPSGTIVGSTQAGGAYGHGEIYQLTP
jgi:uncharacterized repeat protein (TIGR03803 family)